MISRVFMGLTPSKPARPYPPPPVLSLLLLP
nr:MAG TPA: EspF protein repeat [Caudoviricetes sp.]